VTSEVPARHLDQSLQIRVEVNLELPPDTFTLPNTGSERGRWRCVRRPVRNDASGATNRSETSVEEVEEIVGRFGGHMRTGLTAGGGMGLGIIFGAVFGHVALGMIIGMLLGAAAAAARRRAA
jgi:hypothetical protein